MTVGSGCWTCKRRKIGCDRGLPWCGNCVRTGRECLGYERRLLWPDAHDGRRKDGQIVVCPVVPRGGAGGDPDAGDGSGADYGRHFLNVTLDDVVAADGPDPLRAVRVVRPVARPARGLTLHPAVLDRDAVFLSYYEAVISPMVSTVHFNNGFRSELLPMALSRSDAASSALRSAMLAVSAFHHHGPRAALPYTATAVRALSASLARRPSAAGELETQVAASMMLCVYSVFDETEGNWHMHLDGAKRMLQGLWASGAAPPPSGFLFTWFLYHEVLGCFTQPFREVVSDFDVLWLLEGAGSDVTHIVGSLGCSAEAVGLIHRINRLRATSLRADPAAGAALGSERQTLEHRLQNLTQRLPDAEAAHEPPTQRTRILATAELYRLAALLYLQRVAAAPGDEAARAAYLEQALGLVGRLGVATSPWPVFVVACEAGADEGRRAAVLGALARMEEVRRIGNVRVVRAVVEAFWKRLDLRAEAAPGEQLRWWDMVNCETAVPWFV